MPDTLHTTTPEKVESKAIDAALTQASTAVAELAFEPSFQQYLADKHIQIDTADATEYWSTVANYTETYLGEHDSLSQTEKDSFALIANLPIALTNSFYLKEHGRQMNYKQRRSLKENICSYNSLLKHFVTTYPVESNQMSRHLLSATLETIGGDSDDFTEHVEQEVANVLRGVKHEIGFTKILDSLGVTYREASVDEDLKGRDVVIEFGGRDIGVDIKASLSEVDVKNRGSNGTPIAHKPGGDIVMFSMLLEKDFNGGFIPSEQRISEIAPAAGALLQKALMQSIAK